MIGRPQFEAIEAVYGSGIPSAYIIISVESVRGNELRVLRFGGLGRRIKHSQKETR